jgi:dihydrofolate reductase
MKEIVLVAAIAEDNAIGLNNDLLWKLPEDLAHFKQLTVGKTILMGRKTFESVGRPLKNRRNIVVTSNKDWSFAGVDVFHSLKDALASIKEEEVMIVGGAEIYKQSMPLANRMEITLVHSVFPNADTHFPTIEWDNWEILEQKKSADSISGLEYTFLKLFRKRL